MAITVLVVTGAALSLTALFVVATQAAAVPSLAGEITMVGLADPAADTLAGDSSARIASDWHLSTVEALSDAEALLDCLESHGFEERELVVLGNSCFAVRWR